MPTFGWVYSNGEGALYATGTTAMSNSGVYYEETATAITGAALATTNAIAMSSNSALSTATGGTVPTTGTDIWILNQANSIITPASATTIGIEGGISKNMIKATAEKWAKKEAFLAACEY